MTRTLSVSVSAKDPENALRELKLGYINLEDGLFKNAEVDFDMVLLLDPECADAFWGLMLAKKKIRREEALKTNAVLYKDIVKLKEYDKEMGFAEDTKKEHYKNLLGEIQKLNEDDKY